MRSWPRRLVNASTPDISSSPADRRLAALIIVGVVTEVIYLVFFALRFFLPNSYSTLTDLGGWTNHQPAAFAVFVGSILVQFGLYWLAFSLTRNGNSRYLLPIAIGFGVVFSITMIFMYPVTATDIYGYIVRTRILTVYGANPFITVPAAFPQDPFSHYVGGWKDWPTPYGPLFILLGTIPSLLGGHNLMLNMLFFKTLALVSHFGGIALIFLITRRLSSGATAASVLFYAWNPLVLFEALGNGHNDATMMFFVLLAFYLALSDRHEAAVMALTASILVKYITLLLLPILVLYALNRCGEWRSRFLFLTRSVTAAGLIAILIYSPFWQGYSTLQGLLGQANIFISSLPTVILLLLQNRFDPATSVTVVKGLTGVVFAVIYICRLRSLNRRFERHVAVGAEILFAYLVIACAQFESWYVIWPVTLVGLVAHDRLREQVIALCIGSLLSVALFAYVWPWTGASFLAINIVAVTVILLPLFALWIFRTTRPRPASTIDPSLRAI